MSAPEAGEEAKPTEPEPKVNGATGEAAAGEGAAGAAAPEAAASAGAAATTPATVPAASAAVAGSGASDGAAAAADGTSSAASGGTAGGSKGGNLSADAPVFVFGGLSAVPPGGDESDILARLPPGHRNLLRGYFEDETGACMSYYVGRLKSFNNRTGYGFLECAQSKTDWGADVFIHKKYVLNPWHIGQPIEFAVTLNSRGQPQASDVKWLPRLREAGQPVVQPRVFGRPGGISLSAAATGTVTGSPPVADRPAPPGLEQQGPSPEAVAAGEPKATDASAASAAPAVPPPRPQEPRRLGTLKSYVPAQGYGFIACEELFAQHQRDVYFDKSLLPLPHTGWRYGMVVEFTPYFNSRGQPQARSIDWDPIPQVPDRGAAVGAGPAMPSSQRTFTGATLDKLRKLLRLIHEQQRETAVVNAIDAQGGAAGGADPDIDRDVDFVCFVLDRLGPEKEAAALIKDFVKMLLMLMLAKTLRTKLSRERCEQLVRWFEALSSTIEPSSEGVPEHFKGVVDQIASHLLNAPKDNDMIKVESIALRLKACLQELQAKVEIIDLPKDTD
eukprot:CAMPEP_0176064774 /NCGR_PEP_ID=MMETSP0120_2-20121206/32311_1 /TAXON_ID=160619 /ORGANISM="Kryptoperidinium foliaceum, Strain CCMP 1326" /LENGTH=558 /DNA_ID=CAMNT_0017398355 /DNA_START=34 /DNA_END=1710 /DNA_ORIENTATION=+